MKFFTETHSVSAQLSDSLKAGSFSVTDLIATTKVVDGFMCVANAAAVEAMIKTRQATGDP